MSGAICLSAQVDLYAYKMCAFSHSRAIKHRFCVLDLAKANRRGIVGSKFTPSSAQNVCYFEIHARFS